MSTRLSIRGATTTSQSIDHSKAQRDEVSKIQQDVNVLTQKIAELNGDPVPQFDDNASTSSPFVVGLRALADSERKFKDVKELKINTLEKLLEKVAEYDRLLLKETAPVVEPGVVPQRRKSFGQDLYCLPTHMHLTARLMDLHASSKRVTVIKMTEQGPAASSSGTPPLNPTDKKLIEGLKATIAKQGKQLEDAEAKRGRAEEENQQLKRSNEELKKLNEEMKRVHEELKREREAHKMQIVALQNKPVPVVPAPVPAPVVVPPKVESTPAPAAESNNDNSAAEIAALKAQIAELERTVSAQQERIEVETGHVQSMLSVALGKANRLNNHIALDGKGDDCVNLPAESRNAFHLLERAISGRLTSLQAELSLMVSLKDLLEGELGTANLQKDILQRDLMTVQEQHEALKAAYDALSYETARDHSSRNNNSNNNQNEQQSQQQQQAASAASAAAAAEAAVESASLLQRANDLNSALELQLEDAHRAMRELQKLPGLLTAAEEKLRTAVADKTKAEASATSAKEETAHYKKLTETLKQKLRSLSDQSGDNQTFLDTFEEVMKEEMMTMKAAFETKLRLAREEADQTSKKHQQEIVRLASTSPYAALSRTAAAATTTTTSGAAGTGIAGMGAGAALKKY